MDSSGQLHQLREFFELAEDARRKAQLKERSELEAVVGRIVPVPAEQLEAVKAMPMPERRAWYSREVKRERKAKRKRQRDARKAQRRAK